MERFRSVIMGARLIRVDGRAQRLDETAPQKPAVPILHIVAVRLLDYSADLGELADHPTALLCPTDEVTRPVPEARTRGGHPRDVRVIPKSRDFH
jgi:error-prone DNA polymerase